MSGDIIQELLKVKDTPALSINLPTDPTDKARNREALKKAVRKAKVLIDKSVYSSGEKQKLETNLDALIQRVPHAISEGLGIYVSPLISHLIIFPFNVKSKIVLASSFAARDLVYLKDFTVGYLVLLLSGKSTRLFQGEVDVLQEVKDGNFPVMLKDDYEYVKPSIASSAEHSLKAFEQDKGALTNLRIASMLRETDRHLATHLQGKPLVILAGSSRITSAYRKITLHSAAVVGEVHGSYRGRTLPSLASKAWEKLKAYRLAEHAKLISELKDKDNGQLAKGVQESWEAVEEGRGFVLAVEKDYHCHAYLVGSQVVLNQPKKPYEEIDDAIDELINRAARKNVRVVLMENNSLRQYDHVALQCRY